MYTRKSPRAKFHNYSGGYYFVTICTKEKKHYFGKIEDDIMHLSAIGSFTEHCLSTLDTHYAYAEVPLWVVMPNHIHAIIYISDNLQQSNNQKTPARTPTIRSALGVVIGGFKQAVTRFARRNDIEFDWQSRYHDHIIRNSHDGNKIADYIENNVARWSNDCFNICNK